MTQREMITNAVKMWNDAAKERLLVDAEVDELGAFIALHLVEPNPTRLDVYHHFGA